MLVQRLIAYSILIVLMAGWSPAPASEAWTGVGPEVSAIDGDTIEIRGRIIDLYGIDAPELGQICRHNGTPWRCGFEAAYTLQKILEVEHAKVRCRLWPSAGETGTMICDAGPVDLAHRLISGGHVVVLPDAFLDYRDRERAAKDQHVGLWRGKFVLPWEWRAGRRLPNEADLQRDLAPCPVKAVIDGAGRKIYRVPTDSRFSSTFVGPARGKRCFLSDEAARAAGWKRPDEIAAAKNAKKGSR